MESVELNTTIEMAMLELDDSRISELATEIDRMLDHFTIMDAIDVKNVEPTTHALVLGNRTRPDLPADRSSADDALEQAPDLEDRLIAIPNVL